MLDSIDKVSDLFQSWVTSFKPSPEKKSLAEYRASVCDGCSLRREHAIFKYPTCGDCGCPLSKKIFSPVPKSCPENLWMA